jgi:hypothetical protein
MTDRKISYARFAHPVWVDGLGMVDMIDTRPDLETGKPKLEMVSMTWLGEDRLLKVVTRAGETLIAAAASMKQQFEDLTKKRLK